MIATVKIDKGFFDLTIPAAKEPKGIIFAKLETKINSVIQDIADDKLGDVATTIINDNPSGPLAADVKALACVDVFLREMRGLDLVLTPTGFGVVNTNDTAPASKIRVDALDGFFSFLRRYAGLQAPISKDWETAAAPILEADRWLRDKISDEFMDELITKMATNALDEKSRGVVHQIRRIIGVAIQGNKGVAYEYFRRLINTLESDIESFSTYAGSQAYVVNHSTPYENKKDDSAFHFVG